MDYREPTIGEALTHLSPGARFVAVGGRLDEWLGPGLRPVASAIAGSQRDLAALRIVAAGDAALAAIRANVFTADPSQAAIYQEKEREAAAYVEASYPMPVDPALFPILSVEATARGLTSMEQADGVIAKAAEWRAIAAACEAARLAMRDIDQPVAIEGGERSATAAEISAAADALIAGVVAHILAE